MKVNLELHLLDSKTARLFAAFATQYADAIDEAVAERVADYQRQVGALDVPNYAVTEQAPVVVEPPKRGRGRPKKEEPPAEFAGEPTPPVEEPRIPVYGSDGLLFSSVKTPEGFEETLLKLLDQCGDLDDVNGLWDSNRAAMSELTVSRIEPAFNKARDAFAPKPAKVEPPSVDEMRAALKDLTMAHDDGMEIGARILGQFGVTAVSAVPEEKRGEFLAAVRKEIGS